jgi:hypothetical protein
MDILGQSKARFQQTKSGGLQGILEDPFINVGLSLLSESNNPFGQRVDPFGAIRRGLLQTQQTKQTAAQRKRQQQLNKALQQLVKQGKSPAGAPAAGTQNLAALLAAQQAAPSPLAGVNLNSPLAGSIGGQNPVAAPQALTGVLGGQPPASPAIPPGLPPAPPPAAPPVLNPFSQASGGSNSATPGADDISALLLQYGTPEQQLAAFRQISQRENFQQQIAAEEKRLQEQRATGLNNSVQSRVTLDDGSVGIIRRNGDFEIVTGADGRPVKERQNLSIRTGPGGQILAVDPLTGQSKSVINADQAISTEVGKEKQLIEAREETKQTVGARAVLDENLAQADSSISIIDRLLEHPGREISTGLSSILPTIAGTDAADFEALVSRLQSQTFLEGFEKLKGGGTITETEGIKAETALANLSTRQSEEQFVRSLKDLRDVFEAAKERARKKAGEEPSRPAETAGTVNNVRFRLIE